jgi:hypothetical protein
VWIWIWWRGHGLWALLILLLSLSLGLDGVIAVNANFPNSAPDWIFCAGFDAGAIIGGVVCWLLGRSWNSKTAPGSRHSLYSIPVEYWGVIALMLAGVATFGYVSKRDSSKPSIGNPSKMAPARSPQRDRR